MSCASVRASLYLVYGHFAVLWGFSLSPLWVSRKDFYILLLLNLKLILGQKLDSTDKMGKVWTLRFKELNLYLKKIDFCREKRIRLKKRRGKFKNHFGRTFTLFFFFPPLYSYLYRKIFNHLADDGNTF